MSVQTFRMADEDRIARRLREVCAQYGIDQADLAHEVNLPLTSLNYYFSDSGFKGQYLPRNKLWSEPLRKALMARGLPPEEAAALFGMHADSEMRRLQEDVTDIKKTLANMAAEIAKLSEQDRRNGSG